MQLRAFSAASFESAVFVLDEGEAYLSCWREVKAVQTIDEARFGEKERPDGNMIDRSLGKHREDALLRWQNYSVRSRTLTKEQLIELLESVILS